MTDSADSFYTYILLDPRKIGSYTYGSLKFSYEPFYVGKGNGCRISRHGIPSDTTNSYKTRKIKNIKKRGLNVVKILYKSNLSELEAFISERYLIEAIGRGNAGPLTNLTDGGEVLLGGRTKK